jgi:predicted ribosomally synthesized peptide with SipW-like signal peptide
MERRTAFAIMAIGVVVTLLGGTGIFAVFTDRAETGKGSVTSGELPHAADLQIANLLSRGVISSKRN